MNAAQLYQRKAVLIYAPVALLTLAIFLWLSSLWLPLPPSQVNLSSGRAGGMYQEHAAAYRQELQRMGIELEILPSAGTGENLQRLRDNASGVQAAFVQGGYVLGESFDPESVGIQTLAQVDVEPIWVFSRFSDLDSLLRLQGQRVAIGQKGSGSRIVALRLLNQVRLDAKDLLESEAVGMETVAALREGRLDASIFVASVSAPVVQALLAAPGVYLAQLKRSAALSERLPYLDARFAAAGSLNAQRLQPPQDMVLLSTLASVVVRKDMHPMIKRALAHAITLHHAAAGPLHRSNEFPHLKRLEFPSATEGRKVLREGLPWIEQKMPLIWAQWLYRLAYIGLPLIFLAVFLCRLVPSYLSWQLDRRINQWYGELKFIENDLNAGRPGGLEMAGFRARLRDISLQAEDYSMPKKYMKRMFLLHQHISLVKDKMQASLGR